MFKTIIIVVFYLLITSFSKTGYLFENRSFISENVNNHYFDSYKFSLTHVVKLNLNNRIEDDAFRKRKILKRKNKGFKHKHKSKKNEEKNYIHSIRNHNN
jgi:hypothetical protein